MAKRGRPFSEITKEKQYRLNMTKAEFEKLEQVSKQTGLTKADLIRKSLESTYNIIDSLGEKKGD